MSNVLNQQNNGIANLFELEAISSSIKNLENQIEQISSDLSLDTFERKVRLRELNEEKSFLKKKLLKGISIEKPLIVDKIKTNVISFLEQYGFETEEILKKIENIQFYITDERLSSGGLMSSYSNKIAIDYTFAEFDNNGEFLGLKKDSFLEYILTHEILHVCSINSNVSFMDDALSEGYTDLLAHIISKNNNDKSDKYDYFVKICTLLANLVGMKNAIEDYFFNLATMPHLRNLFNQCGLEEKEFLDFYSMLNDVMAYENKNTEEINNLKMNLIQKIKNCIFIPYLKGLESNKENYIDLFNDLFSGFCVSCSYEELNNIVK